MRTGVGPGGAIDTPITLLRESRGTDPDPGHKLPNVKFKPVEVPEPKSFGNVFVESAAWAMRFRSRPCWDHERVVS
jgi:hypothetical protein